MRTPSQGVVESVEEESVVTVSTGHSAHPGNIGQRGRGGRRRGQVDDPLAVWSGAGDPLAGALTDEETVAGTSHVLPARGSVPDGGGLIAQVALDNVLRHNNISNITPPTTPLAGSHLVFLPRDVDHIAADTTAHHLHTSRHRAVGGRQLVGPNGRHRGGRGGGAGAGAAAPVLVDVDRVALEQRLSLDVIIRHHGTEGL